MPIFTTAKPPGTPTWVDLTTPDTDAARAFYQAVFGWTYDIGGPEYGNYTTARLGEWATAGVVGNQPDAPPMPAAWNLYFATDAIETDVARAVALGAQVLYPTMVVSEFGSMATLQDPTGAVFSLWQSGLHVGSQLTEDAGSTAWHELYTTDAKRARDFYAALLGATVDPMPGDMEYYVLKHGDKELCGIMQIDPSWGEFATQWVVYFSVANTDETVATIVRHGGQVMGSIDDSPFGRLAAVMDPAGAAFKVIQPPAG